MNLKTQRSRKKLKTFCINYNNKLIRQQNSDRLQCPNQTWEINSRFLASFGIGTVCLIHIIINNLLTVYLT